MYRLGPERIIFTSSPVYNRLENFRVFSQFGQLNRLGTLKLSPNLRPRTMNFQGRLFPTHTSGSGDALAVLTTP
jgi:hypothetical protein